MNKIFSVDFKYRVASKQATRIASRAVATADASSAVTKLLDHVRTRAGWCPKCNRSSDTGHGTFRNPEGDMHPPIACTGKYESEAEAELHNNPTVSVICEDGEAKPAIEIEINGQKFGPFEQPGNRDNPAVLR